MKLIIIITLYIIGAILTYGMRIAGWYSWYEDRGHKEGDSIVTVTSDVWLYTIGPLGLLSSIVLLIIDRNRYWFKWSFKGLGRPQPKNESEIISQEVGSNKNSM